MKAYKLAFLTVLIFCTGISILEAQVPTNVSETIAEIMRSSTADTIGHPLPVSAAWGDGTTSTFMSPNCQMALLNAGHHFFPSFIIGVTEPDSFFKPAITQYKNWGLPITIKSTQWEQRLTTKSRYFGLPPADNPNVVSLDGVTIKTKLDPMGAIPPWTDVGGYYPQQTKEDSMEVWYPHPPKIMQLSNDEAAHLTWDDADSSKKYVDTYGAGQTDIFKRGVFADGWTERFNAMWEGMKDSMTTAWADSSFRVGYNEGQLRWFGYSGWTAYSLQVTGLIDPAVRYWEGGSPDCYLAPYVWDYTDYHVYGPQVDFMNYLFELDQFYAINPNYWYEISIWDGYDPDYPTSTVHNKRYYYESLGHIWTPERYKGLAQFVMWLTRPRALREFKTGAAIQDGFGFDYTLPLLAAVDTIYNDTTLKRFWRHGTLVKNTAHAHPNHSSIPAEYSTLERWYLLDTNLDSAWPWSSTTPIPVFSIALTLGTKPNREWLVYVNAPDGALSNVSITVPGYDRSPFVVRIPVDGTFIHLTEQPTVAVLVPGNVTAMNGAAVDTVGVIYAVGHTPTVADSTVVIPRAIASSDTFSVTIPYAALGVTYNYKVFGHNSAGRGYGSNSTFAFDVPTVTNASVIRGTR